MNFKIKNTSDCAFFIDLSLRNDDFIGDSAGSTSEQQLNNIFNLSFK